jgi:dipeptidyl aminopeptidase/acylaminoacyl peptidase
VAREKKIVFFGRKSNAEEWKPLTRLGPHVDDANAKFLPVIAGTLKAHAILSHNGRAALYSVDLTDQSDPQLLFWHEQRDLSNGIFGARHELLGVEFNSSVLGPVYLDKHATAIDAALKKSFPNRWNYIEGVSDDGKVYVIRTQSPTEPPAYHVLDTSQGAVKFESIGSTWPGLAKLHLPPTEAIGIPMRTGAIREALFTSAVGESKKAPLVVFADGEQLTGGFEPATYYLASRGYAVLRTYFRGPELDADWWHRPYLDWNGGLYDELIDATRWAAQRPGVDPERICIVGRSDFGGYQALLAATRSDNPFKCVASLSGLSDLRTPRRRVVSVDRIGALPPAGPGDDQVRKESPLARAAEFRVPVLLVEGDTAMHRTNDHEGGREMAAALAAAAKPHRLVLIDDVDEAYLRTLYAELEKFLAANLQ